MRADFEARQIPGGVAMCGTLDAAKLNLVGRARAVDGEREGGFQERLMLVPVDLCGDVDARRTAPERDALCDTRREILPDDFDGCAYRSLFKHAKRATSGKRIRLLFIKEINAPRLKIERTTPEENELVPSLPPRKHT